MVKILYGSGLRAIECLRLRVKDLDFDMNQIIVRDGKGKIDRATILPVDIKDPLRTHLIFIKQRIWSRLPTLCAGEKIQKRRHGIRLAVCVYS